MIATLTQRTDAEEVALQQELTRLRGIEIIYRRERPIYLATQKEVARLRIEVTRWREAYEKYQNQPYQEMERVI